MISRFAKTLIRFGLRVPKIAVFNLLKWAAISEVLKRLSINCVFDVGANRGQFAKGLRAIGYRGRIVSFEPIVRDFNIMRDRFTRDRYWIGRNYALSSENGTRWLNYVERSSYLSSFTEFLDNDRSIQRVAVQAYRLDSVFAEVTAGIDRPRALLKSDTQGHDLEVVRGSSEVDGAICAILSEVVVLSPYYGDYTRYYENFAQYENMGFYMTGCFESAQLANRHRTAELDCLFEKQSSYER